MNLPDPNLKQHILGAAKKHIDLGRYRLFFFGSRVRGANFARSDIDVGIEGPNPLPTKVKLSLEEEFDNLPTLYKIDLIDFQDVSPRFRKEALKHVQAIN